MRDRNRNARYRQKRQDVLAGVVLEKKYGSDFGVHSDMKLETLRRMNDGSAHSPALKEQYPK
ncbi:hypothetical protein SAMN04487895_11857 [Paenibacillus sophorae]|uniref:Uncharacterized protein n=1 Tax=Paenibacillus sophorae TaxID=1333845 RepID=A0A1H8UMH0_9BACL|nr:hypothetical protein [Paenibacillus sophorae]QWU13313.1 hypothetical protein KP014_14985 [Paenibacillus sophorae]SEP04420.1 hypothetical protein SAMN04487895_11857 [Paenibacillus sophorae]